MTTIRTDHRASGGLPYAVLGDGPTVLFLGGFAMTPAAYATSLSLLAERTRVVVPSVFRRRGRWDYQQVLDDTVDILDHVGTERSAVIGHSFGGGLALGLAAQRPDRVEHLVFVDSHGLAPSWRMAADVFGGTGLLRNATVPAVRDFLASLCRRPALVSRAGYWAFRTDKRDEIAAVRRAGTRCDVVFASGDSLVPAARGAAWADELGARFQVVTAPDRLDHEWPVTHPALFARVLLDVLGRTD